MRITITGRNIELTPGIKEAVEEKLGRLEKYFKPETDVNVTLSVEKDRQKVEVTIPTKGHTIRTEQVSPDMYVTIDLAEEAIEKQLLKYRTKIISKKIKVHKTTYRTSGSLINAEAFRTIEEIPICVIGIPLLHGFMVMEAYCNIIFRSVTRKGKINHRTILIIEDIKTLESAVLSHIDDCKVRIAQILCCIRHDL